MNINIVFTSSDSFVEPEASNDQRRDFCCINSESRIGFSLFRDRYMRGIIASVFKEGYFYQEQIEPRRNNL